MAAMMVLMLALLLAGAHHAVAPAHETSAGDGQPTVYIERPAAPEQEQR